jgi:hypothetical protein
MDYNIGCGVIVLAPTRGKARSLAHGSAGLDMSEWIDIEVRRVPIADTYDEQERILDWEEDARSYWLAGWYPEDVEGPRCSVCGLYVYTSISDSHLDDLGVCNACNSE